jgi:hypothetical protein
MTFTLADRYREAFENNTQLDYEIWFDETPDAEESAHQDYLLENLVVSGDVALEMLDRGETLWEHLGWWGDVHRILEQWVRDGCLVRLRMTAQWLLSASPPRYALDTLTAIVEGSIPESLTGHSSRWPQSPEFYRKNLQWTQVIQAAEDSDLQTIAEVKTALFLKFGAIV